MRTRLLVLPLLLFSLLLGACQEQQDSKQNIAVVDLSRLVRDSEPGKAAQTFLENMQKQFNDRLVQLQAKVQADSKDTAAAQELQKIYMSLQQRMQAEEQNVNNVLFDHVLRTVKQFREQKGYKAVLRSEAALDFDKSLDVTDQLLDAVNKQTVEFKPVTKDEAPEQKKDAVEAPADAASKAPAATEKKPADAPKNGAATAPAKK